MVWVLSKEEFNLPNTVTGIATLRTTYTKQGILALNVGIIDPNFEGPISTVLINFSDRPRRIKVGESFFSVHTLAAAAGEVFRNLLENKNIGSWKSYAGKMNPHLDPNEVHRILTKSQNFFKHANNDPVAVLDFEEIDNDYIILLAISEYLELLRDRNKDQTDKEILLIPMNVFRVWFFAKRDENLKITPELQAESKACFPGLRARPRFEQLAIGRTFENAGTIIHH